MRDVATERWSQQKKIGHTTANHPELEFTPFHYPYHSPAIISGPKAPVITSGLWAIETETIVVQITAGNVAIAPAATPKPVWLSTPLTKIQMAEATPRAKWTYQWTRFLPAGVGGRVQQRKIVQIKANTIRNRQYASIETPIFSTHSSRTIITMVPISQIATVMIVLAAMRGPFFHFFGRQLGTHFHEGTNSKPVENAP